MTGKIVSDKSIRNKKLRVAFSIPLPYDGKRLQVIHSANAWWMDEEKIHALELAFQIDATIPEACAYAGITLRQYKYFVSLHPEFNETRELYKCRLSLRAKMNIARALESPDEKLRLKTSIWYLERHDEQWAKPKRKKNQGLVKWEKKQKRLRELAAIPESEPDPILRENILRIKQGLEPLHKFEPMEVVNPEDVDWDEM